MTQIYNVGSTFWGVVFAVWIRWTKHFKYTVLFFGVPLTMLGAGLMIYFRGNDSGIGYIIMCQICKSTLVPFADASSLTGMQSSLSAAAPT